MRPRRARDPAEGGGGGYPGAVSESPDEAFVTGSEALTKGVRVRVRARYTVAPVGLAEGSSVYQSDFCLAGHVPSGCSWARS